MFLLFLTFALVTDTQQLQPRYFHNHSRATTFQFLGRTTRVQLGIPNHGIGAVSGELKTCALDHGRILILTCYFFILKLKEHLDVQGKLGIELSLRTTCVLKPKNLASENNSAYSSDSDCDILSSSDTVTSNMGDIPRITPKQMGGPSMALENQPVRFLELNGNFELKSGLINLLPRFHGMPGEEPIKHLKDFDV
ncbi:hypothetical protein PIB30_088943 [Stylosanthes scabra]|uniref:Uncharacterized protein n=1 Tax=Stylosanthes scabra TaxID=79078 RepID=A0ABU6XVP4_9FABA|nr:hypothetical protein [Stylosanthes scabra]